ncbi:MAG: hypothetical protein MJ252_15505 [archaeon]|nr:hypothetical protein [archaeon]
MAESEDISKIYEQLSESVAKEDYNDILNISQKILKNNPNEDEAIQCKIIALINLNKAKELEDYLTSENKKESYIIAYAYSLYMNRKYKDSIDFLEKNKENNPTVLNKIKTLLAQNYNKLGNYQKSYEYYKDLLLEKKEDLENESDLITNFLASYALSNSNDFDLLKSIQKYISTWECFYNYSLIFLNKNQYNEFLLAMKNCKENCSEEMDEFNKIKEKFLNFYVLQNLFDGFDIHKISNVDQEIEKMLKDDAFKKNENFPYFYNNYLNIKKDIDTPNETIKKLDTFLSNDKFSPLEKKVFLKNKIIFLIRGNKIQEAVDLLNKEELLNDENDFELLLIKSFIYYKNEKDNYESAIQKDSKLKNKIPSEAFILQILLSNLNQKNYENFHKKVLSFVDNFREFCLNDNFIFFFIGFYNSKKLLTYLKEFISKFNNPQELYEHNKNQSNFKKITLKLGEIFYKLNDYSSCAKICQYYLDNVNQNDKEIKIMLVQALSHEDLTKCDEFRRSFDDLAVDLSYEHINGLLNEFFSKFRKTADKQKKTEKKKRKKKIRYPKNFDPKNPGPEPDPERWLPRLQRKKYRSLQKNKLAYQGATADNQTTTTQKFK